MTNGVKETIVEDLARLGESEGVLYRFPNGEVYRAIARDALLDPVRSAQLQIAMRPFSEQPTNDEETMAVAEAQAAALPTVVRILCPTIPEGAEYEVDAPFAMGLLADFLDAADGQILPPAIQERLDRIAARAGNG